MSLESLLWPENAPFAIAIVLALIVLFFVWLALWLRLRSRVAQSHAELSRCSTLLSHLGQTAAEDESDAPAPGKRCKSALDSADIAVDGEIGRHICTIFESGLREASLNVAELNQRTIEGVSGSESALRTFLGTFVIVGLLGTLAGIANAVAAFGGSQPSTDDMLRRLSGAFTPSLYGVAFSILGSLLLVRTRILAVRFSTALRGTTIELLVPRLVPTHTQRIDHAAARAVAAAQHVVEFAENIETRSGELDSSLNSAASSAAAISAAMREMSSTVQATSNTVEHNMQALSQRIADFSTVLDRFSTIREVMHQHESNLIDVLQEMRAVAKQNANTAREAAELARAERMDLLNAMRELYQPVSQSAGEVTRIAVQFAEVCQALTRDVAAVSNQQSAALAAEFVSWRTELNQEAGAAKRTLDNLKTPFEQSAEGLREQAALSVRQMSTLTKELKEELGKRGGELVDSLNGVVEPLRQMAAKNQPVNGSAPASSNATVQLSPDDWTRLERILRGRANSAPSPPNLETALARLDTRLQNLDNALQRVSIPARKPFWLFRLFKRKSPHKASGSE